MNCPKCDADIGDSYEPEDWSCGISAGWYCDACDLAIGEHEVQREDAEKEPPPAVGFCTLSQSSG